MDRRTLGGIDRIGPADVVRRLLDLKSNDRPEVASDVVMPVAEVRALRYFEEFDEGVIRWIADAEIAAQVGTFSGLRISGIVGLRGSSIYTVDLVKNISAQEATIRINGGVVVNLGTQTVLYEDERWSTAAPPPLDVIQISQTPITATRIWRLLAGESIDAVYVSKAISSAVGAGAPLSGTTFEVFGDTVNTALRIMIRGRIIQPQ